MRPAAPAARDLFLAHFLMRSGALPLQPLHARCIDKASLVQAPLLIPILSHLAALIMFGTHVLLYPSLLFFLLSPIFALLSLLSLLRLQSLTSTPSSSLAEFSFAVQALPFFLAN